MPQDIEFTVSGGSGRLKKKKRMKMRKKRPFFSKKRLWKFIFNPVSVLILIGLLAALTYFSLPENRPVQGKFKVRTDNKTKEANQQLSETDVY
jgi:hypothetical protein